MKVFVEAPDRLLEGGRLFDDAWNDWRQTAGPRVVRAADALVAGVKSMLSRSTSSPAARGQPPAFVSGDLFRSVKRLALRGTKFTRRSGVHVDHDGANRLEYGATDKRGITTYPHPFWRPVREAMKKTVDAMLTGAA